MNSVHEQVKKLIGKVPIAADDDRMLLVMYWKVCDGIDIPVEIIQQILKKGSLPETIIRSKRKIKHPAKI